MIILGIDPGLNTTGYGVITCTQSTVRLCEAGVVRTRAKGTMEARLTELHEGIQEIITAHRPDRMAIEQLFSHYERVRTAILMGHARGVICLAAGQANVPVTSYEPTRIKKTLTGSGRAAKGQMQLAIKLQLKLPSLPEPHDVADALAVAICSYHLERFGPIENRLIG